MAHKIFWFFHGIKTAFDQKVSIWDFIKFLLARFLYSKKVIYLFDIKFLNVDLVVWQQIFHVFFLEEYSPPEYKINRGDIVIDVGANKGIFVAFAAHEGARKILAFEPDSDNFSDLSRFVEVNGLKQVKLYNMAIAAVTGKMKMYKAKRNTRHTLMGIDVVTGQKIEEYEIISAISLVDILKKLDQVDLMKMDCEGAEYDIFQNTSIEMLKKIQRIVLEYHGDSNSAEVKRLIAKFEKAGFDIQLKRNKFGAPYGMIYASLTESKKCTDER